MKKQFLIILGGLIISITLISSAWALRPIKLGCLISFPPYAWKENGQIKGIDIDIVNELFKRAKLNKVIKAYPTKRVVILVAKGLVDGGFSALKTPSRARVAMFLDVPIHQSVYKIFVKKGNEFNFRKIEDLYGKKIGINRSFSISKEFRAAVKSGIIKVDEGASTSKQNLLKLISKRIDAVVGNEKEMKYIIKKMRLGDKVVALHNPIAKPINAYLALSKASKLKNKQQILNKLNKILRQMHRDGTINRINSKYMD